MIKYGDNKIKKVTKVSHQVQSTFKFSVYNIFVLKNVIQFMIYVVNIFLKI